MGCVQGMGDAPRFSVGSRSTCGERRRGSEYEEEEEEEEERVWCPGGDSNPHAPKSHGF